MKLVSLERCKVRTSCRASKILQRGPSSIRENEHRESCKMSIYMYLLAKIGFGTDKNETPKFGLPAACPRPPQPALG